MNPFDFPIELQREAVLLMQRGSLRPIQATTGVPRTVSVGDRVYTGEWRWPAEFLFHFLVCEIGKEWWAAELKMPESKRHVMVTWGEEAVAFQGDQRTAGVDSLLQLAYNLFISLNHDIDVSEILKKLRAPQSFLGAAYELHVRAKFLFGGFHIELEDERDTSTSHVEFNAFHDKSGTSVSVEAKTRTRQGYFGAPGAVEPLDRFLPKVKQHFIGALKKRSGHSRVIFIETHMPPSPNFSREPNGFTTFTGPEPDWVEEAMRQVAGVVENPPHGLVIEPLIVCLTNMPTHLSADAPMTFTKFRALNFPGWVEHPGDNPWSFRYSMELAQLPLFMVVAEAGRPVEIPHFFNRLEGIPGDEAPGFYDKYRRRWEAIKKMQLPL